MCNTYSESGKPCGVQRCDEYEALSAREDELNALCLDYKIDLDAARQEIAALKQERDALLKVREAADELAENYLKYGVHPFTREALEAYKEARDGMGHC